MKHFVDGWYSEDLYFNNPPDYLANCTDPWKYNHIRTVLATGVWDFCWEKNERFAAVLRNKGIRHELYVWGDRSFTIGHGGGLSPGRTWSRAAVSLRHTLKMMLHMSDIVFQHEPQCDAIFSKEPDAGKVRLVSTLDGLREMKIKHLPK